MQDIVAACGLGDRGKTPKNLVVLVDVSTDYRIEYLDILRPRGYYICHQD